MGRNSELIRKNSEDIEALRVAVDRLDARSDPGRIDELTHRVEVIEERIGITTKD